MPNRMEEDLRSAYPRRKGADAVLDYGDCVLVFEVVGSQLILDTRVEGDPESFKRDTQKLIVKKARQLDDVCRSLLSDQKALTGGYPSPGRSIVAVVVVAGGYPGDALSRSHVDDLLRDEGLLQDHSVTSLCILSLGELEMLESFHEMGRNPAAYLARWRRSRWRDVPFPNFVLRDLGDFQKPSRMYSKVTAAMDHAARRLSER
jgi:hypothetical protein